MHVVLGLEIGGLEMFVIDLSAAYAESVESIIVCLRGDGDARPREFGNARVIYLDGPDTFSLSMVRKLRQVIKQEKIDVVHTHNMGPHLYGALAARVSGRPVIHTKHGRNYPSRRKKVFLNRVATLFTQRIIAVSRDSERVCREVEGVSSAKLCTILNGIDADRFIPRPASGTLRSELGIAEDTPVVAIVARLSRIKNHPLLFESIQELKTRGVKLALCVVGDGPQNTSLRELVDEMQLQTHVYFMGARNQVENLYPEFDVFVLSSRSEGISLTLLEAMSCELPIVATRVGGNPEVVEDGVTGAIVGEDAVEIADALQHLVLGEAAPERRRLQGQKGRERVQRFFSMKNTAAAYLKEYQQLLGSA
ncbi:MAG: glycosyltransferase [Congregibacter sp.]